MNVLEMEFCMRSELMVSFRPISLCRASFRSAWMLCSRWAILSSGERRCQKRRVMATTDTLERCLCVRNHVMVSSERPSANVRKTPIV